MSSLRLDCCAVGYTDARIIEIEPSDPPPGNGGTNSLPNRPYLNLRLANTAAEIESRTVIVEPSLEKGDVEVTVHDGVLLLRGEKKLERNGKLYGER